MENPENEIKAMINSLKNKKSPGIGNVSSDAIKSLADEITPTTFKFD